MPTRRKFRKNKRKSRKMKGGDLTDKWLKEKFGDLYNNNWLNGSQEEKMESQMDDESYDTKVVDALNAIMKNMIKHKEKELSGEYTCDVKKEKIQKYIDLAEERIEQTTEEKPKDKAAFTWAKEMGEKILAELACANTDATEGETEILPTEGGRRRRRRRSKRSRKGGRKSRRRTKRGGRKSRRRTKRGGRKSRRRRRSRRRR
jgi:hypothetical protein